MNYKHFAKRSLGQNFLVDGSVIDRIVSALDIETGDTIIEIGPGRGALTTGLVESGAGVIAIELDRELVPQLREKFASNENFTVIEADASAADFSDLVSRHKTASPGSVKLVANLPYYISTAILQRLIEERSVFERMVLMFQKEVVDRITAKPGDSDRGFLTVLVEACLTSERLFDVPPGAFRPVPKVYSSVVKLTPKPPSMADHPAFRKLVSAGFAQKRKTILNNLKAAFPNADRALDAAGIDPRRRAETLSVDDWIALLDSTS